MSLFSRALGGAGSAAASIANQYLTEELAQQRAQVIADIQRNSHMQTLRETDAYTNDPTRRAGLRGMANEDALAAAGTADTIALNRAGNTALTEAEIARANRIKSGTVATDAESAAIVTRAQERAKLIKTNPGDQVYDADGKLVVGNTNPTPGQLHLDALREGLKGKKGEDRQRWLEEGLKSTDQMLRDAQKRLDEGVNTGTLNPKAPDPKKTYFGFGADEPGKDPAHDAYKRQLAERDALVQERKALMAQAGGGDGGVRRDPYNVFGSAGGGSGTSAYGSAKPGESDYAPIMRQQASDYLRQLANTDLPADQRTKAEAELARLLTEAKKNGVALDLTELGNAVKKGDGTGPQKGTAAPAPPVAAPPPVAPRMTPQERHDAAQRQSPAERDALRLADTEKARQSVQSQFDADMASLDPVDLVRKYDGMAMRKSLSILQLVQLKRIERGVR